MPLSINEIRDRARAFAKEWADETSERAEAQSFWNEFFNVFGVNRRRVAVFEQKAQRFSGSKHGRIDVFWPGVMLAEHKSAGVDLDAAYQQATDYFAGIADDELPRYVLVSDFQRFRLHDLDGDAAPVEFALADLHREIGRFGFISGYQTRRYKEEDPVNVQAAERMGKLHDALKAAGYDGHPLELLLVRLLFCLFADDTGIFPRQAFHDLISQRTSEDGADLGLWIARLFQVLNTPPEKRQKTLDEQLSELPYVNGKLFEEALPLADFNAAMRTLLLDASTLDWSRISPAIFGSMFQSVMDAKARRNLGAHYTSEKNILKLIGPLFLDGLKDELAKAGNDERKLARLHRTLASLKFLDPACGCGNFLVIAYRELRELELEVLKRQFATQQSLLAHVQDHVLVDVDQFHGIEIEEFPAQIAQVAMWLMDHQMNLRVSEQFGENVVRLPLKKSAAIVHGNALRIDWNDVIPAEELDYILGNPPFIGHHYQNAEQKADQARVMHEIRGNGVIDFVANWYVKATEYLNPRHSRESGNRPSTARSAGHPVTLAPAPATSMDPRLRGDDGVRVAFVSTNSITQGEQVGLLWPLLLSRGARIFFAHRTFQWNNEARGVAAVHCVIVGFANCDISPKRLFDYQDIRGEAQETTATNINPYLVDAPDVVVTNRSLPICDVPKMSWGNKPTDGGHLILSPEERDELLASEPGAAKFARRYMSGGDFINGIERYCLWLNDATPQELKALPEVMKRVEAVKKSRLASKASSTREYAKYPTRFRQIAQQDSDYLAIPEVSSERRDYIPIAFLAKEVICSNKIQFVPDATPYHFGILSSAMHMAWVRAVCGRLKSDFSYSNTIVYNNFPWPDLPTASPVGAASAATAAGVAVDAAPTGENKLRTTIETAAQSVLDARARFPDATLADLYDPLTMPPALVKAHQQLDKAVDNAYIAAEKTAGRKPPKLSTDAERVAFLFERYQALTSLLPAEKPKKARKRREKSA
ncbi:DNA methyltransferase [Pseudoxanthomonas kalamensis]|uniref:DNA methyltransferase n=1 Tax=Pseudoxanthomonas kalamensis TaxID=289483 RepID=UPI0031B62D76